MKKVAAFIFILSLLALPVVLSAQDQANPAQDRYIVALKAGENAAAVALNHGLAPRHIYAKVLNGFAATIPPGILRQLQNDGRVAAILPDLPVQAFGKPGGGGATQTVPEGVKRIGAAPGALAFTGAGIGVAVLDTGLDFNHADLPINPAASYVAPGYGATAQDNNGHGTHVGGIIAAKNNNLDVVGVAPGAALYAVKVLDAQGSGYDSDIIGGLDWVADNAATVNPAIKVVNMSLGRPASTDDSAMHLAIQQVVAAGVSVVVSAGNDNTKEVRQMVPAGFAEVIAVASTTAKAGAVSKLYGGIPADAASSFTTDGKFDLQTGIGVAISAPGEDQENVSNGGFLSSVGILSTKLGGGTTRMSGTSMAAPHAAGVVALIYQKDPTLIPEQVKVKIMVGVLEGSAPLDSKTTKGYVVGSYTFDGEREGILNALNALNFVPPAP